MPVIISTPFKTIPLIDDNFSGGGSSGPIQTVFSDDWGEVSSWGSPGSGDVYVDHIPGVVRRQSGGSLWVAAYHKTQPGSDDVRIEADVMLANIGVIGMFARMTNPTGAVNGNDASGYYFWRNMASGNNEYELGYFGPAYWLNTVLQTLGTADAVTGSVKMRFDCTGDTYSGYIDDVLKIQQTQGVTAGGYVGLIGYHSWGIGTQYWDNFTVTEL